MNKMNITIAFYVYGTLIDTHGITSALEKYAGDRAPEFSRMWREKQLEYSFRRGLMQNYESFDICTSNALDFTCAHFKISLNNSELISCRMKLRMSGQSSLNMWVGYALL